jgi:nicotinate dehydrogenase subunit A
MTKPILLNVNGVGHELRVDLDTPLLYTLRNDCGLNGPKYGCGLGACGACTVLIDQTAARACVVPTGQAQGHKVVTLEGLGTPELLSDVQLAFLDTQAAQCGYCLNGMVMTATALLHRVPDPTEAQIRNEFKGNLCRCGTHLEILSAVRLVVQRRLRQGA